MQHPANHTHPSISGSHRDSASLHRVLQQSFWYALLHTWASLPSASVKARHSSAWRYCDKSTWRQDFQTPMQLRKLPKTEMYRLWSDARFPTSLISATQLLSIGKTRSQYGYRWETGRGFSQATRFACTLSSQGRYHSPLGLFLDHPSRCTLRACSEAVFQLDAPHAKIQVFYAQNAWRAWLLPQTSGCQAWDTRISQLYTGWAPVQLLSTKGIFSIACYQQTCQIHYCDNTIACTVASKSWQCSNACLFRFSWALPIKYPFPAALSMEISFSSSPNA